MVGPLMNLECIVFIFINVIYSFLVATITDTCATYCHYTMYILKNKDFVPPDVIHSNCPKLRKDHISTKIYYYFDLPT